MLTYVVNYDKKLLIYCQNYKIEAIGGSFWPNNGLKSHFNHYRKKPVFNKHINIWFWWNGCRYLKNGPMFFGLLALSLSTICFCTTAPTNKLCMSAITTIFKDSKIFTRSKVIVILEWAVWSLSWVLACGVP